MVRLYRELPLLSDLPVLELDALRPRGPGIASLSRACEEWGVFLLRGHGVDPATVQHCFAQAATFFAQPTAQKNRVRRSDDNPWGFYDAELTKNTRDWKEIYDVGPQVGAWAPRWPAAPASFQGAITALSDACYRLALQLLDGVAASLGCASGELRDGFAPAHTSFLRINHYPLCAQPAATAQLDTPASGYLGVNHHTDSGALTVLVQDDQPGLEVWHQDQWVPVPAVPGAVVVNLGDIAQVWSNDRYRAPLHRVRASEAGVRMSAPFFLNPANSYAYAPLAAATSASPRYRPIVWREFREQRAAGDYADQGQEIQIDDYRIQA